MNRFITFHVMTSLGLHNLNRDGNGLPKSQSDGGVQRGRLSSQSLKRDARTSFRQAGHDNSIRTRLGAFEVARRALAQGSTQSVDLDVDAVIDAAIFAVRTLYISEKERKKEKATDVKARRDKIRELLEATGTLSDTGHLAPGSDKALEAATAALNEAEEKDATRSEKKDTISFFDLGELDALATSIVAAQANGAASDLEFIRDSSSAVLDIAAFGRMFANKQELSTLGAIAVSHAVTVHQMLLVTDYFTAVEDVATGNSGAAHIGDAYFTSGTYYRTFTIDIDQLVRSWSAFHGQDARAALAVLVRALILALPNGKIGATNASTLPAMVLAEVQNFRHSYSFETPVNPGPDGGYEQGAVEYLAAQRRQAIGFDPATFGDAAVAGRTYNADFHVETLPALNDIVDFAIDRVYEGR